jgi:hypothetical protein
MHVLNVRDVNEALPLALAYLRDCGTLETTRNGPAMVAPGPVTTVYRDPRRRVLFDPVRDANPFFHLFESLWILAGRQDVRFLSWFNSRIHGYSDNGVTFHAPYGHRLRERYGLDQVALACRMLRDDPACRRAVLQIWDATVDLDTDSKDLPCNDMVMLRVYSTMATMHPSGKVLDITVCNRSNDAVWGAYGANAVQFSMLQEYMAALIGVGVGKYMQVSNNLHVYTDNPYWQTWDASVGERGTLVRTSEYERLAPGCKEYLTSTTPLTERGFGTERGSVLAFDVDLREFFKCADASPSVRDFERNYRSVDTLTSFFSTTVRPMLQAYVLRTTPPTKIAHFDEGKDWHYAAARWLERRAAAKQEGAKP